MAARSEFPHPGGFVEQVAAAWPPQLWSDVTVLVAVSGGADSVALLRVLAAIKSDGAGKLVAGHFNHRLRGAESDADEAFVVDLCRDLRIPLSIGRADEWPVEPAAAPEVPEAAARMARYEFLRQTAEATGARYVAVAHTADDQVETILHRIVRGTGLAGLAGIPRCRSLGPAATIVRPLLGLWRNDIVAYLADYGQSYSDDRTNSQTQFTRNRIRHVLLPMLRRDFNPQVSEAVLRLGQMAGEAQSILDGLVESLAERAAIASTSGRLELDGATLANEPRYLVRELLVRQWRAQGWSERDMGWAEWEWLATVLIDGATVGVRILPGAIRAEYDHGRLVLAASHDGG